MNKCPICLDDFFIVDNIKYEKDYYYLEEEPIIINKYQWKYFDSCNHGVCRNCWKDMNISCIDSCPICRTPFRNINRSNIVVVRNINISQQNNNDNQNNLGKWPDILMTFSCIIFIIILLIISSH